jgi:hypothetical protein
MKHARTCNQVLAPRPNSNDTWMFCSGVAEYRVIVEAMPRASGIRCARHAMEWEDILASSGMDEAWIVTPLWLERSESEPVSA